jgi:hypothetical protein
MNKYKVIGQDLHKWNLNLEKLFPVPSCQKNLSDGTLHNNIINCLCHYIDSTGLWIKIIVPYLFHSSFQVCRPGRENIF